MKKIQVTALTEKGRKVLSKSEEPSKFERATLKLFGIQEKIISEKPYIVEVSIKRFMPQIIFEQLEMALHEKFQSCGALDSDYRIEVIK